MVLQDAVRRSHPLYTALFLALFLIPGLAAQPAAAAITDAPAPANPSKIKVETFAKGLEYPWGMQFLPDGACW